MKKIEFSKIILAIVMFLYCVTAVAGLFLSFANPEISGEFFTFIGAPTAIAIGFYAWKAKSENVIKMKNIVGMQQLINEAEQQTTNNSTVQPVFSQNLFLKGGFDKDGMG